MEWQYLLAATIHTWMKICKDEDFPSNMRAIVSFENMIDLQSMENILIQLLSLEALLFKQSFKKLYSLKKKSLTLTSETEKF